MNESRKPAGTYNIADVKELQKGALVQNRETGKMATVVAVLLGENRFTARYLMSGKLEGFCRPEDFFLVITSVEGTVPHGAP